MEGPNKTGRLPRQNLDVLTNEIVSIVWLKMSQTLNQQLLYLTKHVFFYMYIFHFFLKFNW